LLLWFSSKLLYDLGIGFSCKLLAHTRNFKVLGVKMMKINRRTLLANGTVLAGVSYLGGRTSLHAAGSAVPADAIILTAMVKAKAGQEDAVKEALMSLVEPTRQEPGCLVYNLHQSKSDPTQFMFYEQWANQEAFDAHGKQPHMKAAFAKLKGKTDKGGGVAFYELLE
jgi:quinol monooxygenase YgiN